MAITAAEFKSLFPEFNSESPARIERFFTHTQARIRESNWGDLYEDAVFYLTAHFLESENIGAGEPVGTVISESIGGVSRSYSVPEYLKNSGLSSTRYGRYYLEMEQLIFPDLVFNG